MVQLMDGWVSEWLSARFSFVTSQIQKLKQGVIDDVKTELPDSAPLVIGILSYCPY